MRAVLSVVIRASSSHDETDGRKVHRGEGIIPDAA
jgi:hypothetical protein